MNARATRVRVEDKNVVDGITEANKRTAVNPRDLSQGLAAKYGKDPEWIERGLQACESAGVDIGHFVRRYLDCDKSEPLNQRVLDRFMEMFVRKAVTL